MGYDFSEEELLHYEKKSMQQLSEEQLEDVTGGVSIKNRILSSVISLLSLGSSCISPGSLSYAMEPETQVIEQYDNSNNGAGSVSDSGSIEIGEDRLEFYTDNDGVIHLDCWGDNPVEIDMADDIITSNLGNSVKKLKIGYGIKSINLKGDEEIDISEARSLESINVTNSTTKYEIKNINGTDIKALYLKGENKLVDFVSKEITIGKVKYTKQEGGSIKLTPVSADHIDINSISQEIRDLKRTFAIGEGVRSIKLQGDDEIEIKGAKDLKTIDARESTKYIVDDESLALYERKEDNSKGNLISIKGKGIINNINYDSTNLNYTELTGNPESPIDIASIPQALRDLNKPFRINEGIRSIKLQGDDKVNYMETAKDLETIDLENSNKHENKNGHLYDKAQNKDLGLINKVAIIKFSLDRVNELPTDEVSLQDFLSVLDVGNLKEEREVKITHENKPEETMTINEKKVYLQIEKVVKDLISKVKSRTPKDGECPIKKYMV